MKTFQPCPACERKVTLGRLLGTFEPHFLKCPGCGTALTFGASWDWWEMISAGVALVFGLPVLVVLLILDVPFIITLVPFFAVGVLFYVGGALLVLNCASLR